MAENSSECTFKVTVKKIDVIPPDPNCPDDITVETKEESTSVTFKATATDDIDPNITIVYDREPGSEFDLGTTTVKVTAIDSSNNFSDCTFKVTVRPPNPYTFPKYLSAALTGLGIVSTYYCYQESEDYYKRYKKEWDESEARQLKDKTNAYRTTSLVTGGISFITFVCFLYYRFKEKKFEKIINLSNRSYPRIEQTPQEIRVSLVLRF